MRFNIFIMMFSVGTLAASPLFSQNNTLDVVYRNVVLSEVLNDLKIRTGTQFVYFKKDIPDNITVTIVRNNVTLEEILNEVLVKNDLTYYTKDQTVYISKSETKKTQQPTEQSTIRVTGRVLDEKGDPLPGAGVIINQTTRGASTDIDGRFTLRVRTDDVLRVSFVGYLTQVIPIEGRTNITIQLKSDDTEIENVVVVAHGSQRQESVVGAITSVNARDLKTSNSDLTASFAGRIPGIIGWQMGGKPGILTEEDINTAFYIRGITSFQTGANIDPLILLDGVEASKLDLMRIDPEDIESFSVLKDASATAMYGARGANGVILVQTKRGEAGSVYTSARYEVITSMPTQDIDVVDPITYMKAYNEALLSRNPLATPMYTADKIENTGSNRFPSWVYPSNDWYKTLFKQMSVNQHMGVNIRGGSDVVQYYASVNYVQDGGMLKTDRLNQFKVNIKNNTTSFRLNLNIDLTPKIKLVVNSSSSLDKYHGPLADVRAAYQLAFNASPVDYAPVYPADDYYNFPHIRFGANGVEGSPYSAIQQGYRERSRFSTINRAEYIHNLSGLLMGLELRADLSLSQQGYYDIPYTTNPYLYRLLDYNHSTGKHTLEYLNTTEGSRILTLSANNKTVTGATQVAGNVRLYHNASWGASKEHVTSYVAAFNAQETTDSSPTTVQQGIPNRNLGLAMRLSYGFRDKIYAEGSFGYNGSERFAKKHRMGFFPAGGLAWIITKEPFMESSAQWLNNLKLRASYGKVGNDGIINTPRFVYLPGINITNAAPTPQGLMGLYNVSSYENPEVTWEVAETVNFGMDVKLFGGFVDITLDAYQEIRHNVIANRTVIPSAVGLSLYPLDNIGKVKSRGIDFSGKLQYAFNNDFWFILNTTLTYNKATYMKIEESMDKPWWQLKVGHDISQQVGYIAEGLFRDQAEIDNSPTQGGDVMPGDIRYRDVNGDGVIDVNDAVHIGYPETPRLIYGFNGFIHYKGFEFNFAFQGSGQRTFFMNPVALSPFVGEHALLTAIYNDHWSTDNMKDRPFWPRLSTNSITHHNPQENWYNNTELRKSTYFMREVSFIRCQSLELGYNLPRNVSAKMGLRNVKVYFRANNPFIISNFKIWDVELGENGFNYPIQRTYSLGINVSF